MSFTAELTYATLGRVAIWLAALWVLLWRGSSSYSEADEQAVPALYKPHLLGFLRRMQWINTVTGFRRRHTAQVLVRSDFVVPGDELREGDLQCRAYVELPSSQNALERAEQPFDAPVHPRAMHVAALVMDAQPAQPGAEHPAGEAAFVVGADELRPPCDAGFAQNLANKMGVPVQAPTELVWAYGNGKMVVAPRTSMNPSSPLFNIPDLSRQGTFRTFTPGAKP